MDKSHSLFLGIYSFRKDSENKKALTGFHTLFKINLRQLLNWTTAQSLHQSDISIVLALLGLNQR